MKQSIILLTLVIGLLASCSTKDIEQEANEQLVLTMKEAVRDPDGGTLVNVHTTYKSDSLCILHFTLKAKNALGMDCSGFTQVIHSLFGHQLLRNANEQVTQGVPVESLKNVHAGDLAFFDHEDGRIIHVGLLLDGERIIHCSGRVKVEKIDKRGIYSTEQGGTYTHHLVSIRRY